MLNPYNPNLLLAWRANMDIQVVGSVYGAAIYVTHYICKDESQVLKQAISEQLANLPANATACDRLRKIGNTLLSHRQLNQQETAFLLTGLHLKGSSRATVFIPVHQLCKIDDSDTNVFLFDRYAAHPAGQLFDNMTLAHYAV